MVTLSTSKQGSLALSGGCRVEANSRDFGSFRIGFSRAVSAYSALGKGEITVIGTKANPPGTGGWSQFTELQENKLIARAGFWVNDDEIRGSAGFYTERTILHLKSYC